RPDRGGSPDDPPLLPGPGGWQHRGRDGRRLPRLRAGDAARVPPAAGDRPGVLRDGDAGRRRPLGPVTSRVGGRASGRSRRLTAPGTSPEIDPVGESDRSDGDLGKTPFTAWRGSGSPRRWTWE